MNSSAEGVVPVGFAPEVDMAGLLDGGRVGVGGADKDEQRIALLNRATRELNVLGRHPGDASDRGLPTQQLLHRGRDQGRILDQGMPVFGEPRQIGEEAAQAVGDGVQPGDDQKEADVEDLLAAEALPIDFGVEESPKQARLTPRGGIGRPGLLPGDLDIRDDGLYWVAGSLMSFRQAVSGSFHLSWEDVEHADVSRVPFKASFLGGSLSLKLTEGRALYGEFVGSRRAVLDALRRTPLANVQ